MAKRSTAPEPNDSDRIEGFAHPRERFDLLGQDVALGRAARALRAGRPPSAWLITGAPGIGKATLAYRIARYLLAHGASDAGPDDLSVPREDPVTRPIPVVVLTADATPGQKRRLLVSGAAAYLTKPFDIREVLRLVDRAIGPGAGVGGS